jgi:hypothetical protein
VDLGGEVGGENRLDLVLPVARHETAREQRQQPIRLADQEEESARRRTDLTERNLRDLDGGRD